MASTTHKIGLGAEGTVTNRRRARISSGWWLVLVVCACAALVGLAEMWLLTSQPDLLDIPAASREARVLYAGFHDSERDARGRYRWSAGDSTITFPQVGSGAGLGFQLQLGPPPITLPNPRLTVRYNNSDPITLDTTDQPRVYRLLVPQQDVAFGRLQIRIQSDTVQVAGDPRSVGLRVEQADLRAYGAQAVWPGPLLALVQLTVFALLGLLLRALRFDLPLAAGVLAAATLAMIGLANIQMLIIYPYLVRLSVALALLVVLTYGALPWLMRRLAPVCLPDLVRALWGATLVAIVIRLTGALYPIFTAHDLALNVGRLLATTSGDLLVTNRSFEFGGGVTVYPPGPYLALQPGLLLGLPPSLLVAGGIAFLDGLGAFGIGLLARILGLSRRSALLAALIYAGMPVGLMALFFGHTAQAFGQAMMVPLLLALLYALRHPRDVRRWLLAALPLSIALLSHIGVTVIVVAWLGLGWLALLAWRRTTWRGLIGLAALVGTCSLLALALVYGTVLGSHLQQTQEIGEAAIDEGFAPAYWLIGRGFLVAFDLLGLLLAPVGLVLLLRRRLPNGSRELLLAWVVTAACFLGIELATGLQVRYIYFLAPMVCLFLGLVLDRLAASGPLARRIAWTVALLFIFQGWITWYDGVLFAERISMVALLR